MKSQYFRFAVLLVSALALGACSTVTNPGAPDQSFDIDQDIQDLEEAFKKKGVTIISFYSEETEKAIAAAEKATEKAKEATEAAEKATEALAEAKAADDKATQEKTDAISAANAAPDDEEAKTKVENATAAADKATKEAAEAKAAADKATKEVAEAKAAAGKATTAAKKPTTEAEKAAAKLEKKESRDQFISQRLTLINIQYIKFIRRFAVEKAQLDTAADMLIIGLNLAGTLVGAASTKGILAAISAGTASSRTSINKNFFHEKTVPVLVTAMNAERKAALVPIMEGIGKSIDDYRFPQALSDLHLYYQAGTFIGALQAIQKDSGAKEKQADRDLTFVRDKAFVEKSRQDRVGKILENIAGLSKEAALNLIQNLPVKDEKIEKLIGLRDPTGQRTSNEDVAKEMLKMAAVMSKRDDEALDAWEAAVRATQ